MLGTSTCSLYSGLFLVANKLEEMLHYIGKALWNLPRGNYLPFLVAALLLQVGPCMPMVHTLSTVLQTAVGWPVIASRAHAKVWNPLTNPEILSCK